MGRGPKGIKNVAAMEKELSDFINHVIFSQSYDIFFISEQVKYVK